MKHGTTAGRNFLALPAPSAKHGQPAQCDQGHRAWLGANSVNNDLVNVYRAKVTPEEEGYLVLDVTGAEDDIQRGIDFVRTFDVTVNDTGKGVNRDPERCTHCGHCVVHCPTKALYIADPATREVGYNEGECIECLACTRVCPYGACASAF